MQPEQQAPWWFARCTNNNRNKRQELIDGGDGCDGCDGEERRGKNAVKQRGLIDTL
jgi:hypothetical protein